MLKTFVISDELLQGYTLVVDVLLFDSVKALMIYVKEKVKALFIINNLHILANKVDNMNFHIHDCKFLTEIENNPNSIIYICTHTH